MVDILSTTTTKKKTDFTIKEDIKLINELRKIKLLHKAHWKYTQAMNELSITIGKDVKFINYRYDNYLQYLDDFEYEKLLKYSKKYGYGGYLVYYKIIKQPVTKEINAYILNLKKYKNIEEVELKNDKESLKAKSDFVLNKILNSKDKRIKQQNQVFLKQFITNLSLKYEIYEEDILTYINNQEGDSVNLQQVIDYFEKIYIRKTNRKLTTEKLINTF